MPARRPTSRASVLRRQKGDVIACCGPLGVDDRPDDEPELAYELVAAVHGQGYAAEAALAVVDWSRGPARRG